MDKSRNLELLFTALEMSWNFKISAWHRKSYWTGNFCHSQYGFKKWLGTLPVPSQTNFHIWLIESSGAFPISCFSNTIVKLFTDILIPRWTTFVSLGSQSAGYDEENYLRPHDQRPPVEPKAGRVPRNGGRSSTLWSPSSSRVSLIMSDYFVHKIAYNYILYWKSKIYSNQLNNKCHNI